MHLSNVGWVRFPDEEIRCGPSIFFVICSYLPAILLTVSALSSLDVIIIEYGASSDAWLDSLLFYTITDNRLSNSLRVRLSSVFIEYGRRICATGNTKHAKGHSNAGAGSGTDGWCRKRSLNRTQAASLECWTVE